MNTRCADGIVSQSCVLVTMDTVTENWADSLLLVEDGWLFNVCWDCCQKWVKLMDFKLISQRKGKTWVELLATGLCETSCTSLHSSSAVRLPAVVVLLSKSRGRGGKMGKFFLVKLDGASHTDGQNICASDKCMDPIVPWVHLNYQAKWYIWYLRCQWHMWGLVWQWNYKTYYDSTKRSQTTALTLDMWFQVSV